MTANTPPKFNSEFTPEKWWLGLEDDPLLPIGAKAAGNFSGANSLAVILEGKPEVLGKDLLTIGFP